MERVILERKKQGVEGCKRGIKINNTESDHRGKKLLAKFNEVW
jgi:hypothetical protein